MAWKDIRVHRRKVSQSLSDEDEREEADFLQDFIFNEDNFWRRKAIEIGTPIVARFVEKLADDFGFEPKTEKIILHHHNKEPQQQQETAIAVEKEKPKKRKGKGTKRRRAKLKEKPEPNPVEGTLIQLAKNVIIQATRPRAKRWSDEETDYEKDESRTKFPEGLRIRVEDKEKGEEEHLTELHKKAAVKWAAESGEGRRFRHVRQELRNLLRQEDMTDEFNRDFNVSV